MIKMLKQKKAQLTLFIIIGILVVASVGVVYYFFGITREVEPEEFDIISIDEYVTACLDSEVKNALWLLGKQGSFLEIYDWLKQPYSVEIERKNVKVNYGITKPHLTTEDTWDKLILMEIIPVEYAGDPPFPAPPLYPWRGFPSGDSYRPTLYGNMHFASTESMQKQLVDYIEERLRKDSSCLNLTVFEKQGFVINKKTEPEIEIMIRENDVAVTMNLSLEVIRAESKANLDKFSARENINLKKMYLFIRNILLDEISDIDFAINNPNLFLGTDFKIEIIRNYDLQQSDLIIIKDTRSKLYGKDYEFWFLRENRGPALISYEEDEDCNSGAWTAVDPDEETITLCRGDFEIMDRGGLSDSPIP